MVDIKRIGVIGAEAMGNGIAQAFAQAGFAVQLIDLVAPRSIGVHDCRQEARQERVLPRYPSR